MSKKSKKPAVTTKPKPRATMAEATQFSEGDQVRLKEDFAGCAAGSEGSVAAVDAGTSSLTVNILCGPDCKAATDVLAGAPMRIFDKNCRCDLGSL